MNTRVTILQELTDLGADVSKLPNTMPYQVPVNYFDNLISTCKSHIFLSEISTSTKNQPYYIPENYFATLAYSLLEKINKEAVADELEKLSPLIASIKKETSFSVPDTYFTDIPKKSVDATTKSKLISLTPIRNLYKLAVAASLVGIMAVAVYTFNKSTGANNAYTTNITQEVIDKKVEMLSDNEIQEYLNKQDVISLVTSSSIEIENYNETNNFFELMSDEEIKQYLQAHPDVDEKNIKGI